MKKTQIQYPGWTSRILFLKKIGIRDPWLVNPGSRMEKIESGILDKHPGSPTMKISEQKKPEIQYQYQT
jgi:hypothetical protein